MKPGVSSSAPPKMIRTPSSTSLAGRRLSAIARLKATHAERPWWRSRKAPSRLSSSSSRIVGPIPIAPPTLMIT